MKRKMVWTGVSFSAGMFFASGFPGDMQIPLMLGILLVSAFFFNKAGKKFIYFAVSALFFINGTLLYTLYDAFVYEKIISYEGKEIFYSGEITGIKDYAEDKSEYRLSGKINNEVRAEIIYYGESLDCDFYDKISFRCTPETFKNTFLFNKKDYYESSGCFLQTDSISDMEVFRKEGFSLRKIIFHYREYTEKKIASVLPGKNGALISAMLTGDKSGLGDTNKKELYRCGTGHMMAVSGMHLVLVVSLFSGLLKSTGLSGKKRFLFTETVILVFVIFSGMTVSVVRAAFMMTLICGAELFGRRTDPLNSLCIASMLLLVCEPFLIKNASFLLSVSGTYGAAVFTPYIISDMKEDSFFDKLKIKIITVFCISACVFPFSVMFFDNISVIAPVSDIILIPLCTCALLCGFALAVSGGIDVIAYPVMMLGGLMSKLVFHISSVLAGSGAVTIALKKNYVPVLTLFLTAFVIFTEVKYRKRRYTFLALIIATGIFMISPSVYSFMNRNVLSVYRVGNTRSAAIVVTLGKNADIVDMTGNAKSSEYAAKLSDMYGIHRIDSVSFLKNPYQSMASYSEKLSLNSIEHVYLPEETYIDYGIDICGCEPEFFGEEGIMIDNSRYRIEADNENGVKIFYKDILIHCTPSEIITDEGIYKEQNIALRISQDGGFSAYSLE